MHKKIITANEANQRLDKFLNKYLPAAGNGFIYKMLRKKNIILNGKKASGNEKIFLDDAVQFFISDETLAKFQNSSEDVQNYYEAFNGLKKLPILFENEHILVLDKPVGLLCQKAKATDISLNEWLIGYLLSLNIIDEESLRTFKPSVLNRLDRNTSGVVLCGKTMAGSQEISRLLKERKLKKYYHLIVKGIIAEAGVLRGYHEKDEDSNKVKISPERLDAETALKITSGCADEVKERADKAVLTRYRPLKSNAKCTLVEAELVTGKSHQIRAHFATIGHPLLGDYKYGDHSFNDYYQQKYGIKSQLLHAGRVIFPVMEKPLADLSELTVISESPDIFRELLERDK